MAYAMGFFVEWAELAQQAHNTLWRPRSPGALQLVAVPPNPCLQQGSISRKNLIGAEVNSPRRRWVGAIDYRCDHRAKVGEYSTVRKQKHMGTFYESMQPPGTNSQIHL
jgi:hypothetical protein